MPLNRNAFGPSSQFEQSRGFRWKPKLVLRAKKGRASFHLHCPALAWTEWLFWCKQIFDCARNLPSSNDRPMGVGFQNVFLFFETYLPFQSKGLQNRFPHAAVR